MFVSTIAPSFITLFYSTTKNALCFLSFSCGIKDFFHLFDGSHDHHYFLISDGDDDC